ncbi:MAG: helix-turn-helix transcriptional regulator [Rhodoferax sp.]|nr:helix-turn-helix transcriptional regulator [Actinomycetota bacterium]
MYLALLEGRAWAAGELAQHAGVARSTASAHLTVLVAAGLLSEQRQGRHRYLRLAGNQRAQLVEDLAAVVAVPDQPSSLRAARASRQLTVARTCYDHLASALGVALFDALVDRALVAVRDGLVLTPAGRTWFVHLAGPDVLHQTPRPPLRTCLDWTEHRNHLGGDLGSALCTQPLQRGWLTRTRQHRAMTITPEGSRSLADLLDLDAHALTATPSR